MRVDVDIARRVPAPLSAVQVRACIRATARDAVRDRVLRSGFSVPGIESWSVAFVSPRTMRALNRQYHGEDRVTDVLAFPMETRGQENRRTRGSRPKRIVTGSRVLGFSSARVSPGEIIICPAYVRAYARRAGEPIPRELRRVLIHGALHLLGYTHASARTAARMFAMQETILRGLDRSV